MHSSRANDWTRDVINYATECTVCQCVFEKVTMSHYVAAFGSLLTAVGSCHQVKHRAVGEVRMAALHRW